ILPQMKNSLNIVVTFTLINSFKVFDLIYVMTAGGPGRMTNVMATWSYYSIFRYYNYGTGSAMSIMLAAILLIGSLVVNRVFRLQKN
ncbi:MAG: sugar ABC transporter permease, partial [Clostridia bacterium]